MLPSMNQYYLLIPQLGSTQRRFLDLAWIATGMLDQRRYITGLCKFVTRDGMLLLYLMV